MSLETGLDALKEQKYEEAIQLLETFCDSCPSSQTKAYIQAQMGLVKAYHYTGNYQQAIAICRQLATHHNAKVSQWAKESLSMLYTPEMLAKLKEKGREALKQKRYEKAIKAFRAYCRSSIEITSSEYQQVQMWLINAYKGNLQWEQAKVICKKLAKSSDLMIQDWAKQEMLTIKAAITKRNTTTPDTQEIETDTSTEQHNLIPKAGRAKQTGIKLLMPKVAHNLSWIAIFTLLLPLSILFWLVNSLMDIMVRGDARLGLIITVSLIIVGGAIAFLLAPLLLDKIQHRLHQIRWINLTELKRISPESVEIIQRICQQKNLKTPRLAIIDDRHPIAFSYRTLPNQARLLISRGLIKYLDDEEIATVYAHELGHILHWTSAVITIASSLLQFTYLIYIYTKKLGYQQTNPKLQQLITTAALIPYNLYLGGNYLLLYLSRTREYYADHLASQTTGNPNGLARALVKIAYGITKESPKRPEISPLLEATRAIAIYDYQNATSIGTAYRIASDGYTIGRLLLWDLFNPWAWWLELNSTHPLIGKRIRVLSLYSEQLTIDSEFDISHIIEQGKQLDQKQLFRNFILDICLYNAQIIGIMMGFIGAIALWLFDNGSILTTAETLTPELSIDLGSKLITLPFVGFGIGTMLRTILMYPNYQRALDSNIISLMSDPYASPFRGLPVKLTGKLIRYNDTGYYFSPEIKFQDHTGLIFTRYCSRCGAFGNIRFDWTQLANLSNSEVTVIGWFRHGLVPWLDLVHLQGNEIKINSYHRFWSIIIGITVVILGFIIPIFLKFAFLNPQ